MNIARTSILPAGHGEVVSPAHSTYPIRGSDDEFPVLPFAPVVYLPYDFMDPVDRQLKLQHIQSSHVHAWDNRFKKELNVSIAPDASDEDKQRVYTAAYNLKKVIIEKMRMLLSAKLVEIGKDLYAGNKTIQFTLYSELAKICVAEVSEGRGEIPWMLKYGSENFPPLWENAFAEIFCNSNGIILRTWTKEKGIQSKNFMAKLASYALGQLRAKIPNVTRRLPSMRDEEGNRIRRRFKYATGFDPILHTKPHAQGAKANGQKLQYNQL